MGRRRTIPAPAPARELTPLERVNVEIAEAKARAKALQADEEKAAHALDDTRWRVAKDALGRVWKRIDGLEMKRAQIMAGEEPSEAQPADTLTAREDKLFRLVFLQVAKMIAAAKTDMQREIDRAVEDVAFVMKAVKDQQPFAYRGPWRPDEEYARGNFASHSGSMWHANSPRKGCRPGDGPGWTLAVKAGRDGK